MKRDKEAVMRRFPLQLRRWRRRPVLLAGGLVVAAGALGGMFLGPVAGWAQSPGASGGALEPAVSLERVQQIARDGRGEAAVLEVRLDRERGRLVYEVTLSDGTEVAVDATNEDVIAVEQDNDHGATGAGAAGTPTLQPAIGLEQAQQTALAQGGGAVEELELKVSGGTLRYEIELADDTDVTIDATTGGIQATEREDDD